MEAKDTVMSKKMMTTINDGMPSYAKYGEVFEVITETQAAISFKVGMDEGYSLAVKHYQEVISPKECADARKEVVDWIEGYMWFEDDKTAGIKGASNKFYSAWQAQKKKWGIE